MGKIELVKTVVVFILMLGLAGCFTSKEALIGPNEADFPFSTITYVSTDGEETTLVRDGNVYSNPDDDEDSGIRLKAVGENTYVAQIAAPQSKEPAHLYALVQVASDRRSFRQIHAIAGESAQESARAGRFGFSACKDEMVCIGTLEGFVDFALSTAPGDNAVTFEIRKLE